MKNVLQGFAESLSNAELADLGEKLATDLTKKAEQTRSTDDIRDAFIVTSMGYRLAQLANAGF